jgi:DNA-binding response OmpR family regulator
LDASTSVEPGIRSEATDGQIALGLLRMDFVRSRVTVADVPVELTVNEFALLQLLLDNADRIVAYAAITERLWGASNRAAVRHLNVIVHRLRAKLGDTGAYQVKTVRGRGYGLLR